MSQQDPFAGLEDWAKKTERKVRRSARAPQYVRLLLAFAVAGVLVVVALPQIRAFFPGSPPAAYATQAVPSGISVTTSESAAPTDPFEGTPAATYPKGAAGITLPHAAAADGFTAAQVSDDLQKVRRALVATRLDDRMLTKHDPQAFLLLLAPGSRAATGTRFQDAAQVSTFASQVHPSATLTAGEQPRVSGRITYAVHKRDGVRTLQVTTNFVWVYAFTGRDLVTVHDETTWNFPRPAEIRPSDRGMWLGDTHAYSYGIDCLASRTGMLAPTRSAASPYPTLTEDPDNLMRPDHSLSIPDNCS